MVSHDLNITRAVYEEVISAKTAALFAAACELGAVVSNKPEWREPLRVYGQALGMAFQLVDDALDYQANETDLGKAIGDDFRDGKVTLPVIIAYEAASPDEKKFWEAALQAQAAPEANVGSSPTSQAAQELSMETLRRAKELLIKHKAFEQTLQVAHHFADAACKAIANFPNSPAKTAMLEAAEFAVGRGY